jgi:hypothetical protein
VSAGGISTHAAISTKRIALTASILSSGIVFLDGTIVNVALPAIRAGLDGGFAEQQGQLRTLGHAFRGSASRTPRGYASSRWRNHSWQ